MIQLKFKSPQKDTFMKELKQLEEERIGERLRQWLNNPNRKPLQESQSDNSAVPIEPPPKI